MLAALMGWSTATMARMAKCYGHISDEALSAAFAVLDAPKTVRI